MPNTDGTMTPQERRVAQLHDITPTEIEALWHRVRHWIYDWSLARLAFDHALEQSFKHYDGRKPIVNYITKVANNWVMDEHRKHAREQSLEVIREFDTDLRCLGMVEDELPSFEIGCLDDKFIHTIERMLIGASKAPGISPLEKWAATYAELTFREFLYSVRNDEGVGINEYEEPGAIRDGHQRHEPRRLIEEHMAATLSAKTGHPVGVKTVQSAMAYLRRVVSTAREIVDSE